jgi:1,4-alpha-glucan branching enzyme
VRDFILDGAFMWLSEYHMDGFRWDSVANIRALDDADVVPMGRELLVAASDMTHAAKPGALAVAEDLKGLADITQTTSASGFGFDAQWDGFGYTVDDNLALATDTDKSMTAIRDGLAFRYNDDPFQRVIYTENHDIVGNGGKRIPDRVDSADPTSVKARKGSMMGAALVLTSPGVPMLFEGQELLTTGAFTDTGPAIDWTRAQTYAPVLKYYRDLVALRRNLAGKSGGLLGANVNVFHVNDSAKVLGYHRWNAGGPGDDVVVILNFQNKAYASYDLGLPRGGTWHVLLNGDSKDYSSDFGGTVVGDIQAAAVARDSLGFSGAVPLAPYGVLILAQ